MPSFRSILLFASATLVAFVAASPSANTIQALPGVLTAAKTQLLALQADVNHASTAGSVVDATAANVYVDKIASIVSIAQSGARISCTGQPSNGTSTSTSPAGDELASAIQTLIAEIIEIVEQLLGSILGSVSGSSRDAIVAKASASLDDPLSSLLSQVSSVLSGLLSAVSQLLSGILGSLRASGLKATSNLLTQ